MASVPKPKVVSPDEYIALELTSPWKHEYLFGEVVALNGPDADAVAMSGGSGDHALITLNIGGELRSRLKGKPCLVYSNDMRVRIPSRQMYTYPDVTVVCGQPQFEPKPEDTLQNPTVLVEVLSQSTERYDQTIKAKAYRTIPSLQHLVFVAQEIPYVTCYTRQATGLWLFSEIAELGGELTLDALDCVLPLSEIYYGVEFPPSPTADEQP